uniref:N-alpha-acetyltransferase 60 n=1 Tax=Arcella intermedia TaxID=1963864 RepID=A0A6B2LP97_9EUKA
MTIGVESTHRRQGLGVDILRKVLFVLAQSGCSEVHLDVKGDNKAAVAFYRRHGFVRVCKKEGFYLIGEGYYDAYGMVFRFPSEGIAEEGELARWMVPREEGPLQVVVTQGGGDSKVLVLILVVVLFFFMVMIVSRH